MTPRQYSTDRKTKLLGISRPCNVYLRKILIGMAIFSISWRRNQNEVRKRAVSRCYEYVGYVLTSS